MDEHAWGKKYRKVGEDWPSLLVSIPYVSSEPSGSESDESVKAMSGIRIPYVSSEPSGSESVLNPTPRGQKRGTRGRSSDVYLMSTYRSCNVSFACGCDSPCFDSIPHNTVVSFKDKFWQDVHTQTDRKKKLTQVLVLAHDRIPSTPNSFEFYLDQYPLCEASFRIVGIGRDKIQSCWGYSECDHVRKIATINTIYPSFLQWTLYVVFHFFQAGQMIALTWTGQNQL
jgi:hypothetical protein